MKEIIYKFFEKMPYFLQKKISDISKNERVEGIVLNHYLKVLSEDFDNQIEMVKKNQRCYKITKGRYKFEFFDVCFANAMLGNIVYCLYKGYIPVFENVWTDYFFQPFAMENYYQIKDYPRLESPIQPCLQDVFDMNRKKMWGELFSKIFVTNDICRKYLLKEESIIKEKKVLGVLVRGTDYVKIKPAGHPIQPSVETVLTDVKKIADKYEYIYLATDELAVVKKFEEIFPKKILTNKRKYFDIINEQTESLLISQIHFERENDNFLKGLEYLSSLNLLSKCNSLIAGNCGGATFAYYMNDMKYEFYKIYNLGTY